MIHAHHHPVHTQVAPAHQTLHARVRSHEKPHVTKKHAASDDTKTKKHLVSDDTDTKKSSVKGRHHAKKMTVQKSNSDIDVHKFASKLQSISAPYSTEKCAQHVRIALEVAGANVNQHPIAASDWGRTLEKNGYHKISPKFNSPQEGDIYIIQRTGDHIYGHIAGYTSDGWVSDFRQKNYAVYKEKDVKYSYYRLEL
ncbi:CHAP domain-containing protein [Acinetobacter sp. MD2]|uniref:CHAP domain-containing protein n=1 Tax=Acinetobacter sp. MD2 TaxID=2600066 RepID=UPI002D1F32EC|nr:CHAP domain-containing protein [Acinetobacter sp. MD2]MEB3767303.1 CHAP domain-containing protein [Acinetobacter sp. MD2]